MKKILEKVLTDESARNVAALSALFVVTATAGSPWLN